MSVDAGRPRVNVIYNDHDKDVIPTRVYRKDTVYLPGDKIDASGIDLSKCIQGSGVGNAANGFVSHKLGTLSKVNQVLMVEGKTGRYTCTAGDLVVGRAVEVFVAKGLWQIDVRSQKFATLPLVNSVLPGSEQRRRNQIDQMNMRSYLDIHDVVLAEVQRVSRDGTQAVLHTRNLKYGRLNNGVFVQVPSSLIGRSLAQYNVVCFDDQTEKICGYKRDDEVQTIDGNQILVVLGTNGGIWIGAPPDEDVDDTLNYSTTDTHYSRVKLKLRSRIARLRAIVIILAIFGLEINWKSLEIFLKASGELDYLVPQLYDPVNRINIYKKVLENIEDGV